MNPGRAGRFALTILLAVYGFRLAKHPDMGSLMDNVDLPIHETGHLLFSPFGELKSDQIIGNRFWTMGVVLYVVAICGGLFALTSAPVKTDEAAIEP